MRLSEALLECQVFHARSETAVNAFKYPVLNVLIPLYDIEGFDRRLRKKFMNLVSLRFSGYLSGKSTEPQDLRREICDFVQTRFQYSAESVYLQTIPKMLGYVFNPVSFWYFMRDKQLDAVLCEVNNTFGERHYYWLHRQGENLNNQWLECKKEFHVSPFFDVAGKYKFHFLITENKIKAHIRLLTDEGQLKLNTWIDGTLKPLHNLSLAELLLRYGWMTPLVVVRIHYQAVKLFFKKVRFYKKPPLPPNDVTTKASGT